MSHSVPKPHKITIAPDSEIARLLKLAVGAPLLLEKNGELYRVNRMDDASDDIWADYDPDKVRAAVSKTAGSWNDVDAEMFVARIKSAREEGSRPATRP